jgi:hypothetical protein
MLKDNIFTIPLPGSNIVLTRYLYLKKEVILYLILDILERKDNAIYWACELYNSGFKIELFEILWKIYYNFFASLNPSYEAYLFKKQIQVIEKNDCCEKHIATIVRDFLLRPYNADVFLLKTYNETFENNDTTSDIQNWVQNNDYISISFYILNNKSTTEMTYNLFLDAFAMPSATKSTLVKQFQKIKSKNNIQVCEKTILLARIMSLFQKTKKTKETKKYALIDEDDIRHLKNNMWIGLPPWKILLFARISKEPQRHFGWGITDKMKNQVNELLHSDKKWLYHASFSPLWYDRIKQFHGFVNHVSMCVCFLDEMNEDAFCQHFDYEPDEQPYNLFGFETDIVNDLTNGLQLKSTWKTFCELYNQKGLVQLDEKEIDDLVKFEFPFL